MWDSTRITASGGQTEVSNVSSESRGARRRTRGFITTAAALTAAAAFTAPAGAAVSGSHVIATLPSSSGLELTAYPKSTLLDVSLVRNNVTIAHGTVMTDAVGDGAVNGGGAVTDCWNDVTPEILPGDEVHVIGTGFDDSSIVQGTSADMPVKIAPDTVVVHGTASDAQGGQLPITGVEARITTSAKALFSNGKRVLRAGTGQPFSLSYDTAGGTAWTATYSGLSADDVALAINPLESRGVFTNAAANESTISQNPAAPGPSAPCTAPALRDAATSSTPSSVNIAHNGEDVVVSGVAQDATGVSVTLDDVDPSTGALNEPGTLTGTASAQTWSATFPGSDVGSLAEGSLTATPTFALTAGGSIGGTPLSILKDLQAPGAPVATPAPGAGPFHAPQSVSLSVADSSAKIHWTNDGTTPDASSPVLAHGAQIPVTASQTIRAVAIDPAGNPGAVSTLAYTILPAPVSGGTGSTSTTIIQQIPFVVPLTPPSQAVAPKRVSSPARPAVRGLSVAVLRGHALRVTMRLGSDANVVRLRVLRAHGGAALVTALKPTLGGRVTIRLSGRAMRALRSGSYVLEARAGASRGALGAATRKAFRLR